MFDNIIVSWSPVPATTRYIVEGSNDFNTGFVDVTSSGSIYNSYGTITWYLPATETNRFYRVTSAIDPILDSFVTVQGGTFNNGVSDVTLSSFQLGQYELTQTAYTAIMGHNPSGFISTMDAPVEQVSWLNAIEYCNQRSIAETLTPCYSYNNGTNYGTNPHGAASGTARVLKGGSWLHDTDKCTVAYQGNGNAPALHWDMNHLGFRVCRIAP